MEGFLKYIKASTNISKVLMGVWLFFAVIITLGNISTGNGARAISCFAFLLFIYVMFGIMLLVPAVAINQSAKAGPKSNDGKQTTKSWITTLSLGLFLGLMGAYRFYIGKTVTEIVYCFTAYGLGIGYIVGLILIALGKFTDKDGNLIRCKANTKKREISISKGTDDNFEFDLGYNSPYSSSKFVKDMAKFENKDGKETVFVPFMQYWPSYDSMSKQQKDWYFYWRSQVRKGIYLNTDLSYIFVHVYELLSGYGLK